MPSPRRPSAQARARKRAGRRRLAVLLGLIVVLVAVVVDASAHGGSSSSAKRATDVTRRDAGTDKRVKQATVPADPLTTAAMKAWVASRQGDVSVAVDDLGLGRQWLLHPGVRAQTASIIKVDILETVLHQAKTQGVSLASVETETAQQMIEASDNDDATALWDQIGGADGLGDYNQLAGLTQTTPNDQGFWGETLTSAADQIKLLRQLALPSKLLSTAAQDYELDLMENIDPGENWGVTGGVPSGVTVALKNGWVPLTSATDWEINSIGWIRGDGRDYLLAAITAHDPSEQYGIDTINRIAADVFKSLKPAESRKSVKHA